MKATLRHIHALNKMGNILTQANRLSADELEAIKEIIGAQIVNTEGTQTKDAEYINRIGDYHLKIFRAVEQIREAFEDFNTYKHGAEKECINYL